MYKQNGIWIQFNRFLNGTHSGPSNGHGYALQSMLLLKKLEMAQRGLDGLVEFTYDQGQRRSPYYLFEQWRMPPVRLMARLGCGELNLVNVTEPLKVARMIIGMDDRDPDHLRVVPRLPPSWTEGVDEHFPVRTSSGVTRATIRLRRQGSTVEISAIAEDGKTLPISVISES